MFTLLTSFKEGKVLRLQTLKIRTKSKVIYESFKQQFKTFIMHDIKQQIFEHKRYIVVQGDQLHTQYKLYDQLYTQTLALPSSTAWNGMGGCIWWSNIQHTLRCCYV